MEYFVVFIDYGENGLEAAVDPELTVTQIVSRIKSREYDNIVQIDRIDLDLNGRRTVTDVTQELIDAAENELADPFGPDEFALPHSVLPPVRGANK